MGATTFTMREEYTGPLAGLVFKSIPDMGPSFQQFADGLKQRAEQTAGSQNPQWRSRGCPATPP